MPESAKTSATGNADGLEDALYDAVAEHDSRERKLVNPQRMAGDVINIDYTTADVLVHDQAKQLVGGVQQGCLLIAVRLDEEERPDPKSSLLLLRTLSSSPLPNDAPMRQARFDAAQRVAESADNWDDQQVTDLFTLNMMRYTGIHCRILGTYRRSTESPGRWLFSSDLDNFYSGRGLKVYKPTGHALEKIVRDSSRADNLSTHTKIGHIRYAASTPSDVASVYIAAEDFIAQRTALFGMTRTGKSNTVKTITRAVFEMRSRGDLTKVGQIIFDPNGEYANDNPQDQGCIRNLKHYQWSGDGDVVTYGLNPHPNDPGRRITRFNFYGDREPVQNPGRSVVEDSLSSLFQGKRILDEFLEGETAAYLKPFVNQDMRPPSRRDGKGAWIRYRRALLIYRAILAEAGYNYPSFQPNMKKLFNKKLQQIMQDDDEMSRFVPGMSGAFKSWAQAAEFAKALAVFVETKQFKRFDNDYASGRDDGSKWSDSRFTDLLKIFTNTRGLNILRSARDWHDPNSGRDYSAEIVKHLQKGRLVIVDQSIGTPQMNESAARDVMSAIFKAQQHAFTVPTEDESTGKLTKPPPIIIYLEEAHTLLPHDGDDMSSVWVRTAKEGAKFNIGLVYSTQEPSTVQANILKNTENWFIAHLNNTDETRQLAKFNDFSDFTESIINVNEPGYLKMRTRSNRFTLPVQIDMFEAPSSAEVS